MTINDFDECLSASHRAEDLPLWRECYQKAFSPYFQDMFSHRQDGAHQRAGIDRTVILTDSRTFKIDEKIRFKDYGDVLLEFVSNDKTRAAGWVCKPLSCDYIAYAIAPAGKCYMLPVLQLQQAWLKHGEVWKSTFKPIAAKNNGYSTLSVGIPVSELFKAIGSMLRIEFTPYMVNP